MMAEDRRSPREAFGFGFGFGFVSIVLKTSEQIVLAAASPHDPL
jgi:hypothetical protein